MTVTTADLGAARLITWDRQARRNAWDLRDDDRDRRRDRGGGRATPEVRCIVLRGAGDHFSAGDDLQSALEADSAAWAATIEGFQRLTRVVLAAPVPAIAAVDGVCVGGALEFAASCDLRLCTDRVRLITPEVGIGLVASNAGTLLLPEVLGETAARELLLGGEPRDADWARRHGFATELVAPGRRSTRASSTGPRCSRARRAPRWRRPRRCSTSASARCSPRRWTARPTTACACSTRATPRRRCRAFAERRKG